MDGLLLKITYDFLNDLEKRGLVVSSIRVKLLSRDANLNSLMFKSYADFNAFLAANKEIIFSKRFLCSAGTFLVVENITITNKNLNFNNSFGWYNITDKRFCTKRVEYDNQRKDIYEQQLKRYLDLMYKLFDRYTKNINTAIKVRLNSYVDPCYVDAGYISPNSEPLTK